MRRNPRHIRILCSLMAFILSAQCLTLPVQAVNDPVEEDPVVAEQTVPPAETGETLPAETGEASEQTLPADEQESSQKYRPPFMPAEGPEETTPQERSGVSMIPSPDEGVDALLAYIQTHFAQDANQIPMLFQTDYPNVRYGSGTIATSGCGIVCLAMVGSYLTGYTYKPDELADYFGGAAENNMERLELGSDALGLPWEKSPNFHVSMDALKEGKIVIALMEKESIFTDGQHFIVLKGMTEDGKILVNDPNEKNYEIWNLEQGFKSGFTQDDILKGYSGGWIYDPEAMPEDPVFYFEEPLNKENTRYPGVELTLKEEDLLASMIWVEARGESPDGQQAIAEVVLNRLVSGKYGETISNVIYGEGQFESVPFLKDAEPSQAQYEAIERALYGINILPIDVYYFATYNKTPNIWGQIGGHIFCYGLDKEM